MQIPSDRTDQGWLVGVWPESTNRQKWFKIYIFFLKKLFKCSLFCVNFKLSNKKFLPNNKCGNRQDWLLLSLVEICNNYQRLPNSE